MQVKLIAITHYLDDEATSSGTDSEALLEHAGRICYRSTAGGAPEVTARFVARRVEEGHESIIEHACASFEVSGISRACSHQLVRHRLASYSQESQRYVDMSDPEWVIPPGIAENAEAMCVWDDFAEMATAAYHRLRALGIRKEDARFLLPNATATRLVMTANYRELLHIFRLRISPQAQWEIREVCARMLEAIYPHAPSVFQALRDQLRADYPALFAQANGQTGGAA
jgi:thymidylate synthase (FAD)